MRKPLSFNIAGRIVTYDAPAVMGIVNVTDDSFYGASRAMSQSALKEKVSQHLREGADMIDIGAVSSRPGSNRTIDTDEECRRLSLGIEAVRALDSAIPISIDTTSAAVAHKAVTEMGADIINDISMLGDPEMAGVVAEADVPYILMHMRGTPSTMQDMCDYTSVGGVSVGGVTAGVISELSHALNTLSLAGVNDVIIDPGLGFGKTLEQNYELLSHLDALCAMGYPVLVGLSRKSMLTRLLDISADEALNATTAANMLALTGGASILRVHDVAPARQCIAIYEQWLNGH